LWQERRGGPLESGLVLPLCSSQKADSHDDAGSSKGDRRDICISMHELGIAKKEEKGGGQRSTGRTYAIAYCPVASVAPPLPQYVRVKRARRNEELIHHARAAQVFFRYLIIAEISGSRSRRTGSSKVEDAMVYDPPKKP
jgi:hypothetical protein